MTNTEDSYLTNFLKEECTRLSIGNSWLVWYQDEWVVFQHNRKTKTLYSGNSLQDALNILKGE